MKKKNREKILTDEKLIEILRENKKEIISSIKKELVKINNEAIFKRDGKNKEFEKQEIYIPASIFASGNAAESLCRYLHEDKKLKFSEIAKLINRDQRTVWVNYNNSLKSKGTDIKKNKKDEISIPINVFAERKLSIFESLVNYLREKGFKNSEIAEILDKDSRNIGTFYSRVKKKIAA